MLEYPYLFQTGKIGNMTVKNRIVMAPMGEVMGNTDGTVSDQMIAYYAERAKGGTGIIIPGFFAVDCSKETSGKPGSIDCRIDERKFIKNLDLLARAIHRYGSLLVVQISHAGAQTTPESTGGVTPVCVSNKDVDHILIKMDRMAGAQRELKTEEIPLLIEKYVNAAVNCKTAGCDGVEVHGAHGYLINQFLSPHTNSRTDEYGGSLENRMRFGLAIIRGIREKCGKDFVVGVRTPGREWVKNGLSDEDCQTIAKAYEEAGCDFIDVSVGETPVLSTIEETQYYNQGSRNEFIEGIKKSVNIPVMAVSALKEPGYCNKLLEEKKVDFVEMGRQLICDPYWPQKAYEGKGNEIRKCISCLEGCFKVFECISVGCALNPTVGEEREFSELKKTETPKNVVVIGGGPGGMQVAITSAQRGHHVVLLEKEDKLGGQLNIACVPPHKDKIAWVTEWFSGEVERQGVDVRLGCNADEDLIKSLNPDVVIAATGSTPFAPSIPGLEKAVQSWDLLDGSVSVPENKNITIIGGGIVGCEVAEMLAEKGNNVTILEMLPTVANGLEGVHQGDMFASFAKLKVNISTSSRVKTIESDGVKFEKDGIEMHTDADMVVLAIGQKSYGLDLVEQLKEDGINVSVVGDACKPGKIMTAIRSGFYAGLNV